MYNKLFTRILDSSIWLEPNPTRIVWITMLAAMDQDGYCRFASVRNLAHRAVVTEEEAEKAVETLQSPDENSGNPAHGGRRIERVDGGWLVLNAKEHRETIRRDIERQQNRERQKRYRDKRNADVTDVTPMSPSYAEAEAEAEAEIKNPDRAATQPETAEKFAEIRAVYPRRAGSQRWQDAEKAYHARIREKWPHAEILEGVLRYAGFIRTSGKEGTEYVMQAATFLGKNRQFLEPWAAPPSKAQAKQDANVSASRSWLESTQ